MKTIIISICLTCQRVYNKKDGKGKSGISHGYCLECHKVEIAKLKEEIA